MTAFRSIWTFLTTERFLGREAVRASRKRRPRQRGIAIVIVLIAISMTLVLTNQFGTSTNIDMIAAANYRDQMRSHFLARSAMALSEIVIRLQQRIDNQKELRGTQITDFADQILLAFCGTDEEVKAAVGFSSSEAKGLGADIGTCGIVGAFTTEDDKLNLNCANGNAATATTLKSALDALVFFPAYDPIFEEEDAEGYRRDRATQVSSIVDYIDSDSMRNRDRGTTEDYGYESLKDPYRPKKAPGVPQAGGYYIDTIDEIKLARGVDDRFWSLFGPSFTVYGGCKTNLSALTNSQLVAAIIYLSAKNPNDQMLQNPQKLFALAGLVAKAKMYGMQFTSLDDFIDFVKDPSAQLGLLAGQSSIAGSAASAAMNQGIPGITSGEKLGIELDKTKLQQLATVGPRRTYRVMAWGEIERKQKNADGSPVFAPIRSQITGVWDTKVVLQNVRKPPMPKGAWVYLKED
jgi:type II secretory pathway component PulK